MKFADGLLQQQPGSFFFVFPPFSQGNQFGFYIVSTKLKGLKQRFYKLNCMVSN